MSAAPYQPSIDDFFDLLPIVADRGWVIHGGGSIRDKDGACPICALVNEIEGGYSPHRLMANTALETIGLATGHVSDFRDEVVLAADMMRRSKVRDRLIEVLNPRLEPAV